MSLELLGAESVGDFLSDAGAALTSDTGKTVFSVIHPVGKVILSAFGAGAGADAIEKLEQQGGVLPKAQPTPPQTLPSDGRPSQGWSQPRPDLKGPAITPSTPGAQQQQQQQQQVRQQATPTGWRGWSAAKKAGVVGGSIAGVGLFTAIAVGIARRIT